MDDLIILVLFILASLASYISKHRELKRQKKMEAEREHSDEDFEWPDFPLEPEFKPITENLPSPPVPLQVEDTDTDTSLVPGKLSNLEPIEVSKGSDFSEREQFSHLLEPRGADSGRQPVSVALHPAELGRIREQSAADVPSSVSRSRKRNYATINLKSKPLFRKAIIAREILDRPRAYDI